MFAGSPLTWPLLQTLVPLVLPIGRHTFISEPLKKEVSERAAHHGDFFGSMTPVAGCLPSLHSGSVESIAFLGGGMTIEACPAAVARRTAATAARICYTY